MGLHILKYCNFLFFLSCLPAPKDNKLSASSSLRETIFEPSIPDNFRRWKDIPLKISFSTDFSQNEITILSQYLERWNEQETYFSVTEQFSNSTNMSLPKTQLYPLLMSPDKSIIRIYKAFNWNNFNPMSLGTTITSFIDQNLESGQNFEQITGAFVLLNMTRPLSLSLNNNSFFLPTVITHEVGHALGLDHLEPDNFVMNYNLLPNTELSPQLVELDLLKSFYQFSMKNTAARQAQGEDQFREHDFLISGCSSKTHTKKMLLEKDSHL